MTININKKTIIVTTFVLIVLYNIKKILVLGMIGVGAFVFPEASQSLKHYCFGNGEKLVIKSNYIRRSPVVLKHLKTMKVGQKKKVGMHQWEDWRLSYAINPFTIEKRKHKVIISQWIEIDRTGKVFTWVGPIPIPDNIVYAFGGGKPFMFYHEFPI